LTARLNHPHVVSVFNFVVDADTGAQWLVMEYVDGTTLAHLVREEGKLSPGDAAPLLWQAADALVAAHSAGIVHRDVKPSNILVDRSGRVKLTDFGIARIAADPSLTQTGLVTGSPAYLAPEVAAGHRGDEAVDVWSLGATLFHVLSGRPPYEIGDNVFGGLYRLVNEEPPRLAEAGWMTPLLEATMCKDPSRRWSMAQVREFLSGPSGRVLPTVSAGPVEAHRAEEPTSTRLLGSVGHAAASGREASRPAAVSRGLLSPPVNRLLVGLALSLVLGLVLFAVLSHRESTADNAAESPSASPADSTSSQGAVAAGPTARGMKSFIREYVAAVASDPDAAFQMLTPKFQRESGGLDTYREFWSGVGTGRILDFSADPRNLVVSYRVRFDNFGTGRRPTVLDLVFHGGRYFIDGEHTAGFVPAG
jgi:serine/threonine protein kinase